MKRLVKGGGPKQTCDTICGCETAKYGENSELCISDFAPNDVMMKRPNDFVLHVVAPIQHELLCNHLAQCGACWQFHKKVHSPDVL